MFWFQLLVVLLVLGGIAWVAAGRGGGAAVAYSDRPDLALPDTPLTSGDVDRLHFSVGLRGYRMDEVDRALDRLADELALRDEEISRRDARIAELVADRDASQGVGVGSDEGAERTAEQAQESDGMTP